MALLAMNAMRVPSGDHRTLAAPSGAPLSGAGSPPVTGIRKSCVIVLFAGRSIVATENTMVFPSGEGAMSPIVLTASVSAAEKGRGAANRLRMGEMMQRARSAALFIKGVI